jgi:hypothetical protein
LLSRLKLVLLAARRDRGLPPRQKAGSSRNPSCESAKALKLEVYREELVRAEAKLEYWQEVVAMARRKYRELLEGDDSDCRDLP